MTGEALYIIHAIAPLPLLWPCNAVLLLFFLSPVPTSLFSFFLPPNEAGAAAYDVASDVRPSVFLFLEQILEAHGGFSHYTHIPYEV